MKKSIVLLLFVSFALQGCATYRGGRLPSNDVFSYADRQEQEGVYVVAHFLDERESKQIFQFNLIQRDVQPVFLIIDNRSPHAIQFKKANINKSVMSADEVADKCKFSTVGRATGYGVAGLFLWPLLIPAVVDGVGSAQANRRIEDDYLFKEIKDERILPNGLLNGIVFIPRTKEGEDFTIRLNNIDRNKIMLFSFKK